MIGKFLRNYGQRHLHPGNQVLHAIGLPVTFILPIVLLVCGEPWWALASFVIGYALQFLGHAVEGNDAGETVLVKRWLGKPYTEFGPRAKASSPDE